MSAHELPPRPGRPPLCEAILDPGYTPRARDLDALVELLDDEDLLKPVRRAVGRLGEGAVARLLERLASSQPPVRARLVRVLGQFVPEPRVVEALLEALRGSDPAARRSAARELGQARGATIESALLEAWDADARPEMRRVLAASLGKVGGPRAEARLAEAALADDAALQRVAGRGALMASRTASREARGRIDPSRRPPAPVEVVLVSKAGLEGLLVEELAAVKGVRSALPSGSGAVRATLDGPLEALFAARTWLAIRVALPPEEADGPLEEVVARALGGPRARAALETWTEGKVRYRLAWADGGHHRAATWAAAQAVARRAPELVNDPTASLWEVIVARGTRHVDVALSPRGLTDPRWTWRRRDVPAASHPTLAAALARVAGVEPGDVVWDPFMGSAGELVERARLGPTARLYGSDRDPRAIDAARENLEAAGVAADLRVGDAVDLAPPGVTLVLTNPPMGRRAAREDGIAALLDRFVAHAAEVLEPGGRLVWVAPWPARARAAATKAGLALERATRIDMGGFDAELQRWRRGNARRRRETG